MPRHPERVPSFALHLQSAGEEPAEISQTVPSAQPISRPALYTPQPASAETDAAGYAWEGLLPGQQLAGPAIVEGRSATAYLPPGWTARVNDIGAIVAELG